MSESPAPSSDRLVFRPADGGIPLVIEEPIAFAIAVFAATVTSVGSFDARITLGPSDRFVQAAIDAMNSVMATRTKAATLLAKAENALSRLELLDPAWSMTTMSGAEWSRNRVAVKIGAAVRAFGATWPNVAVVTKLLYLKRPDLVPIIDSYVVDHLGPVDGVRGAMRTFRENCVANAPVLHAIQSELAQRNIDRSPLRILETCLWAAHPRAPARLDAGRWERVVRATADR